MGRRTHSTFDWHVTCFYLTNQSKDVLTRDMLLTNQKNDPTDKIVT